MSEEQKLNIRYCIRELMAAHRQAVKNNQPANAELAWERAKALTAVLIRERGNA